MFQIKCLVRSIVGLLPALFILIPFFYLRQRLKRTSEKNAQKCIRWENLAKTERTDGSWKRQSLPIDRPNFRGDWSGVSLTSPDNVPTEIHERIFLSSFRHGISRLSVLLFLFANPTTCSRTTKTRQRQSLNVWHGRSLVASVLVSRSLSSSLDYAFCSHR